MGFTWPVDIQSNRTGERRGASRFPLRWIKAVLRQSFKNSILTTGKKRKDLKHAKIYGL